MSITTEWRIPSTYQEVEWIWRNGNNYIDTWRVPKQTVPFEVQVWYKISTSWVRYWVLSNYSSNVSNWELSFEINSWSNTSNKPRYYLQHSQWSIDWFSSNTMISNSFNDIKFINNASSWQQINLNWTLTNFSWTYYWISQNYSAYLFIDRQLRRSTFNHDSSVSYLKIYENWTLIKDFIPCYRKSDNVIGFWERIWKQFYTNKGSWTFSKGWNV